jgi:transposase InsO family protein
MDFHAKGHSIGLLLRLLGLPRSTFYHKQSATPAGRPLTTQTFHTVDGWVPDEVVTSQIHTLLAHDFVDYGYRKVTEWLKWHGRYLVNHKKVLRLMRTHELVMPARGSQSLGGRQRITEKVPQPSGPGLYFEMDIKYIKVQGANRNALILNLLDIFHRQWHPYILGWNIRKEDVMRLIASVFPKVQQPSEQPRIRLRTDNGSQFIGEELAELLKGCGIGIEYTHNASPEENGHVESFHSVLERALIRRFEFESMAHLRELMERFFQFYNYERLHSATCSRPPMVFLELWEKGLVTEKFDKNNKRKFLLSKEGALTPPYSERNICSL